MMEKTDKIYVAGHRGLVGSAIVRNLESKGYTNIIGRTHRELDLTNQQQVRDFFEKKSRMWLSWQQPRWVESMQTIPHLQSFAYENMRSSVSDRVLPQI